MRPVFGNPRKLGCVMSATPPKHSRIAIPTALPCKYFTDPTNDKSLCFQACCKKTHLVHGVRCSSCTRAASRNQSFSFPLHSVHPHATSKHAAVKHPRHEMAAFGYGTLRHAWLGAKQLTLIRNIRCPRQKAEAVIDRRGNSLGWLFVDEERPQDCSPDGRSECEHESVIQRQQ